MDSFQPLNFTEKNNIKNIALEGIGQCDYMKLKYSAQQKCY